MAELAKHSQHGFLNSFRSHHVRTCLTLGGETGNRPQTCNAKFIRVHLVPRPLRVTCVGARFDERTCLLPHLIQGGIRAEHLNGPKPS